MLKTVLFCVISRAGQLKTRNKRKSRTIHPGVNPTCTTKAGLEGSCIIACPPFVKASTRSFNLWIGFV